MKKIYGVMIRAQEIIPPIGNIYKYFASIQIIESGVGRINFNIPDITGEDKEITIKKAKDAVYEWFNLNKKDEDYEIDFD